MQQRVARMLDHETPSLGELDEEQDCCDAVDAAEDGARSRLSTEAVRSKSEQDLARTYSLDLLTVS